MKPIRVPPATRLEPAPRARETLLGLVSDLMRRSWLKVDVGHYLDDYEASQWLTPSPLKELQLAKLRRLVWHCFLHVPWYSARIASALPPSEIERLGELSRLPVARATDRADAAAFRASVEEPSDVRNRRVAVRLRAERWAGAPPGKIVAVWGRESARADRALEPTELEALVTAIARVRGAVVSGPGEGLGELAAALASEVARPSLAERVAERVGDLVGRERKVVGVIARGADPTGGGARLAEQMGARLSRWYTTAEVGLVAATCDRVPSPTALHVQADHLIAEVLDDAGRVLPPGAEGRIHVTDLHEYASPIVRFATAERGRLLPHPCPCGRSLPLLELSPARVSR
jgi:phenylacetate-CoA ligase